MQLSLNPALNIASHGDEYAKDKRVRVSNIFSIECASDIAQHIHEDLAFVNAYIEDGEPKTIASDDLAAQGEQKQRALTQKLYQQASQGIGFWYGQHQIVDTQQNALSQQVLRWLNSPEMFQEIQGLTGIEGINYANAQATRYFPGHFLTRHNDLHPSANRKVAYVLNFTPTWHPDWGGMLQFFTSDGTPKDAWMPEFNSMSLFDVNHPHSVTYVAPFARNPRLSITGWFMAR